MRRARGDHGFRGRTTKVYTAASQLPAFYDGDPLSGTRELDGKGRTSLACTDDDGVEIAGHRRDTPRISLREITRLVPSGSNDS
jgi:hypothetical protein